VFKAGAVAVLGHRRLSVRIACLYAISMIAAVLLLILQP